MRVRVASLVVLSLVLASVAWAGSGEKCTYDTQVCLNHLAKQGEMGYLGIDGEMVESGYKVVAVKHGTPAEKAGIHKGDILIAINGVDKNDATFEKVYFEAMRPGNTVTFTAMRGDKKMDVKAKLVKMPEEEFAKMVGRHMLEHAETKTASRE